MTAATDADAYAVALICGEIDQWQHNAMFVSELAPAFAAHGIKLLSVDYRAQPRLLSNALKDSNCLFMLCFNGFGSELQVNDGPPGRFRSAWEFYQKPLFDLMHDCPAHESMGHQLESVFRRRILLLTDYGYVGVAKTLGVRQARFVASITFPMALPGPPKQFADRSIDILLPMGFQDPELSRRRHSDFSYRRRAFHSLFEAVVEACVINLRLDPLHEVFAACHDAGINFDPQDADCRFLLTTTLDYVKFERRRRIVRAVAHLPVSIMSRTSFDDGEPGCRLRGIEPRSAIEMLRLMADTRCVICPLPHMTGYHERALGAFTAGAGVVSAPNHILETVFRPGKDLLIYQTEAELVAMLEDILANDARLADLAERGRQRALQVCAPTQLAETVMSLFALEQPEPRIAA